MMTPGQFFDNLTRACLASEISSSKYAVARRVGLPVECAARVHTVPELARI